METVLDALKAMKKASAREIAARMAIEPRDALEMLNEQQEIGTVTFLNGYWSLSGTAPAKAVKRRTPEPEVPKSTTVKIGEPQMLDVIREHGPQTAEDLATLFGITSRKVTSTLAMATGKGRLIRVKRDGKYWYCLPGPDSAPDPVPNTDDASTADTAIATASDNAESAPEVVVEESAAVTDEQEVTESLEEISRSSSDETESVSDTPLADAQPAAPDVMELPSPRAVAKNLRRHKAQLARLQKAHSAVQAVRRYGLQVTPAPKEIVREIRRLTAIVEASTKLSGAVSTAKKYLIRMNRYEN
ncbi:DNA glycosylase AlkZ-like family protein [Salmonella enterica]|uniref:DNA glycosylase AlkZ-like family protein n=1 Tax=Salmonella enterica TaxID=28901 RepID=UPI003D30FC8F